MSVFAALDVSQELTAVCVVNQEGSIIAEAKLATCPDAITAYLEQWSGQLERLGMETGPLAVWLWNGLVARGMPIIGLDARHANGVLKMMPNKTDRHDARGLAQIVRTGWYKAVQIKSHEAYVTRALLTARDALVGIGEIAKAVDPHKMAIRFGDFHARRLAEDLDLMGSNGVVRVSMTHYNSLAEVDKLIGVLDQML